MSIPEFTEYFASQYSGMIADRQRMEAYLAAMKRHISSDSVVLDLGTGIGIIAVCACKLGARKVYAIEANNTIALAHKLAKENKCEDRIEFIHGLSTEIELPEKVDVIVSDLRGVFPLYGHHIPTLIDARQRFLKPAGQLLPYRDTLWLALLSDKEVYQNAVHPWGEDNYGLELGSLQQMSVNGWSRASFEAEQLISEPAEWASIDYQSVSSADVRGEVSLTVTRPAVVHGFALWFDAQIAEGIGFSCAPDQPRDNPVYGNGFFPWSEPQELKEGDRVDIVLEAKLIGDNYIWSWQTEFEGKELSFQQSTFYSSYASPASLKKRADSFVPALGQSARIDQFVLAQMEGSTSLGDISRKLVDAFPECFQNYQDALAYIGSLSEKYSE